MADEMSMARDELVRKAPLSDDVEVRREGVRTLAPALMEAQVAQHLRAGRYERTVERTGRWWPWSQRRTCTGCPRGVWMSWSRRWAWRASARARSDCSVRNWTARSSASARVH